MSIRHIDTHETEIWAVTNDILPPPVAEHRIFMTRKEAEEYAQSLSPPASTIWTARIICTSVLGDWRQAPIQASS